jgi:hypothetical protein
VEKEAVENMTEKMRLRSRDEVIRELQLRKKLCDPDDATSIRRGWVEALRWVLNQRDAAQP